MGDYRTLAPSPAASMDKFQPLFASHSWGNQCSMWKPGWCDSHAVYWIPCSCDVHWVYCLFDITSLNQQTPTSNFGGTAVPNPKRKFRLRNAKLLTSGTHSDDINVRSNMIDASSSKMDHDQASEQRTRCDSDSMERCSNESNSDIEDTFESAVCGDESGKYDFDGTWNNRGFIYGGELHWLCGPVSPLLHMSSTSFNVVFEGTTYRAELLADDKLHWDDGDVWTRQTHFNGSWRDRGVISGDTLTWTNGPTVPLVIIGDRMLEMSFEDHTHAGELREDGRLHWDDGDIWTREELHVSDVVKAKRGHALTHNGSEIFGAGDEGIVTRIDETNSEKRMFDIIWKNTGKTSKYYVALWMNAFTIQRKTSHVDFTMYSMVKCTDVRKDVPSENSHGIVVGFTDDEVEVKFDKCIARFPPRSLQARSTLVPQRPLKRNSRDQEPSLPCTKPAKPAVSPMPKAMPVVPKPSAQAVHPRSAGVTVPRHDASVLRSDTKQKQLAIPLKTDRHERSPANSARVGSKRYEGTVTYSRGSMAWLNCDALPVKYSGLAVFLHKNDCDCMPKQFEEVSFDLGDSEGRPKAFNAKIKVAPERTDARDYFRERQRRRE